MPDLDRRSFLRVSGAAAGIAVNAAAAHAVPALQNDGRARSPQGSSDVIVIGAGPFGGWTALCLRERGVPVTLVDMYGPGNSRASSGGETRQIRPGYGDREVYTRWAIKALGLWKARQKEFGKRLYYETGRLLLAPEWTAEMKADKTVFDRLGVKYDVLGHQDVARRYPQVNPDGVGVAMLELEAGVLKARESCQAVAETFEKKGGRMILGRAEPGHRRGSRLQDVVLNPTLPGPGSGAALSAQTFVFACGPWLLRIFPEVMKKKLFTPRGDVFFFGPPAGDSRFRYPNLPNFAEGGFYGFPDIDNRGIKVRPPREMAAFDPDSDERIASPYQVKRARDYVTMRFPALKDQPIIESRVCQLEYSVDEHFIIDKHPEFENVWIAGGGSGHAFKHGPVLGEYIAGRVLGRDQQPELAPMFRLKDATF